MTRLSFKMPFFSLPVLYISSKISKRSRLLAQAELTTDAALSHRVQKIMLSCNYQCLITIISPGYVWNAFGFTQNF